MKIPDIRFERFLCGFGRELVARIVCVVMPSKAMFTAAATLTRRAVPTFLFP